MTDNHAPHSTKPSTTVKKAVIPAAGLGTRVLPASKAIPKEMLTVVDRPAIEYVIEEAVAAGIEDILIVTSGAKKALEDHFDRSPELEALLESKGKLRELAAVRRPTELADFHYIRQGAPLGLGHAVGLARHHVGDQPFAVLLPDEILADNGRLLSELITTTTTTGASSVALRPVPREEISRYGCPQIRETADGTLRIETLVEKPAPETAPSLLAVVGRYVFTPDIFAAIDQLEPGVGGELQLTDAMASLARLGELYGVTGTTPSLDTGNRLDYLKTVVELALRDPEIARDFHPALCDLVNRYAPAV